MTIYQCSACGSFHDSSEPPCPQTVMVNVATAPPTAREVGRQIRDLLLSLRAHGHEPGGIWQNYSTDQLRAEALQHAGFCWLTPGEMAPECVCDWHPDTNPAGPMLQAMVRMHGEDRVREHMPWLWAMKGDGSADGLPRKK